MKNYLIIAVLFALICFVLNGVVWIATELAKLPNIEEWFAVFLVIAVFGLLVLYAKMDKNESK